jgi:hypothetical protein
MTDETKNVPNAGSWNQIGEWLRQVDEIRRAT